jgi:hypothetical protein
MKNSYYVKASKLTSKISDSIIDGYHIMLDRDRYEKVSKKPYGKVIVRNLIKLDKSEKITCYA